MIRIAIISMILTSFTGAALAQHFDVKPKLTGGQVAADGYSDATSTLVTDLRVFGYDFGEDPGDPFFIGDPGFNTVGASNLPASVGLKFNVLGNLQFWDGAGAVSFADVATGESLRLFFGSSEAIAGGSSGAVAGFTIATTGANGSVHRHLNAELLGPDSNSVPAGPGSWGAGDGVAAAAGVYLLPFELYLNPSGGIAASDPLYLVFNNGVSEETHDAAIDYVQTNLAPEPSSLALLAMGGIGLLRRRRGQQK